MDYIIPFNSKCEDNKEGDLNITEIIKTWKFNAEEYNVTTSDGYILTLNRVYRHIKYNPIILSHGIFMNSLGFVNRREKSHAYILANEGYDVWLTNFRGTIYGRKHVNLTENDKKFWNFTFHDMAVKDLPAIIDLVTEKSKSKPTYIGFSMGTTIGLIYSSVFAQEAKDKLSGLILMAPVAYLDNLPTILNRANFLWNTFSPLAPLVNGRIEASKELLKLACSSTVLGMKFCYTIKSFIFGYNFKQLDPPFLPLFHFMNHDAIAIKLLHHYVQIINSGKFQQFDHGKQGNLKEYSQENPPIYNISKIDIPVALFVGKNDQLATKENAHKTYAELNTNSRCGLSYAKDPNFAHADFIEAKDNVKTLLEGVLEKIKVINAGKC